MKKNSICFPSLIILCLFFAACASSDKRVKEPTMPALTVAAQQDNKVYDYSIKNKGPEKPIKKQRIAVARFQDNLVLEESPFGKYQKMPDGSIVLNREKKKSGNNEREEVRIRSNDVLLLQGNDKQVNPRFQQMVINELQESRRYIVIERQDINQVLREVKFGQSKWADKQKVAKAGKQLGAELIVSGSIGWNQDLETFPQNPLSIYLRIYKTSTSEIIASERAVGKTAYQLIKEGIAGLVAQSYQYD